MKVATRTLVVATALLLGGCSNAMDTPTSPTTTTPTLTTVQFAGRLAPGGSRFYSFTVSQSGAITATLVSIASPRSGAALDMALGLGVGRPAGTGCALSSSVTTGPALTAQLQEAATSGIYCINVHDVGNLTTIVDFAVRFSFDEFAAFSITITHP